MYALWTYFFEVLTLLLDAISWSKQLMRSCHFCGCRCSTEHQRLTKWNWACHDYIHGEYHIIQDGGPKMMILLQKKTGNLSLFCLSLVCGFPRDTFKWLVPTKEPQVTRQPTDRHPHSLYAYDPSGCQSSANIQI